MTPLHITRFHRWSMSVMGKFRQLSTAAQIFPSVRWRANWCCTMIGQKTDRTRFLRQTKLEPDEVKLIDDVEEYGCHIIQVRGERGFPGWSYTIGLSDVLGCPELIVVGLEDGVAHSLLNECARRLQEGFRFEQGSRAQELLAN